MVTFLFITRSKKVQSDVKVNKSIMTVNKMRANWMINHFSISILIFSINCFILSISCFTRSRHPHTLKRHSSKRNVALPKNIAKDNESNNQQDLKKYWPGKSTQNANDDEQSGSSEFWPVANKRSRSSDRWQKEYGISEGTAGMLSMIQNKNEIGQNSSKRFQKALNKNSYLIKKFEGPRAIICNKEKPFKVAGGRRGISDEGGGKFDYKSMSSSFWRLDYDYLSTSLNAIEVKPALSFEKSDDFLLNWWHFAKKWDVLGSELLGIDLKQLDDVLTSDSMSVLDTGLEMGVGSMDDRESMATNAESENIQKVFAVSSNVKEVHSRNRLLTALRELCEINLARVICVGDVHGCEHELRDLLKAVNYRPCDCVLLLGDMVGKGPRSVNVVKMAREIGAVATCGNHDHEVIRRAQIDRRANSSKPKESSSRPSEHLRIARALSDEDIAWMERLPYAIFSPDLGSLFVHAAVQNDRELERQSPWVVMMARSVRPDGSMSCRCEYDSPWAKGWKGPLTCYFGHDAARGLQIYEHAVGLDTGTYLVPKQSDFHACAMPFAIIRMCNALFHQSCLRFPSPSCSQT